MLLVRFVSLGIAAVAIQQIAESTSFEDVQDLRPRKQKENTRRHENSVGDVQDLVKSSYADVLAWGVDKLTALSEALRAKAP